MDPDRRPVHARPDDYFSPGPATVVTRLEVTSGRVRTPLTSPSPPLGPGDGEPTGREDGRPAVEGVTNWLYHRPSTTVPFYGRPSHRPTVRPTGCGPSVPADHGQLVPRPDPSLPPAAVPANWSVPSIPISANWSTTLVGVLLDQLVRLSIFRHPPSATNWLLTNWSRCRPFRPVHLPGPIDQLVIIHRSANWFPLPPVTNWSRSANWSCTAGRLSYPRLLPS